MKKKADELMDVLIDSIGGDVLELPAEGPRFLRVRQDLARQADRWTFDEKSTGGLTEDEYQEFLKWEETRHAWGRAWDLTCEAELARRKAEPIMEGRREGGRTAAALRRAELAERNRRIEKRAVYLHRVGKDVGEIVEQLANDFRLSRRQIRRILKIEKVWTRA